MALFIALMLCFTSLAIAGRQTTIAIEEARNANVDESELLRVTNFHLRLMCSKRFWAGLSSGSFGVVILVLIVRRAGLPEVGEWLWGVLMFFLPGLAANQAAGLARAFKLPGSMVPVSTRWLGASKTWGSYYGVLVSIAIVLVQARIPFLQSTLVEYKFVAALSFGILMGLGAAFGDHAESFLKRRIGIPPGEPWWPWDQTDFAIAGGILTIPFFGGETVSMLLGFLILMLVVHPVGNYVGFRLRLRSRVL